MKYKLTLLAIVLLVLALCFAGCNNKSPSVDTYSSSDIWQIKLARFDSVGLISDSLWRLAHLYNDSAEKALNNQLSTFLTAKEPYWAKKCSVYSMKSKYFSYQALIMSQQQDSILNDSLIYKQLLNQPK